MNYYSIATSTEIEKIGFYPQARISQHFNSGVENSYSKVDAENFPAFVPAYELTLADQAIPTDVIDRGSLIFGLVVSDKLKRILESLKLPPHRFYPVKVNFRDSELNYFWFHHVADIWRYLDTKNTTAYIFNVRTKELIEEFSVLSRDFVTSKKRGMHYNYAMQFKNIHFTADFPGYDIFELTGVQYGTIISEQLKSALEAERISGYEIKPYDRIHENRL